MPSLPSPACDRLFDLTKRVLRRDDDFLVIDKPAGLPVHLGTKTTDHLELYLQDLVQPGEEAPRLAHRLDKDTSGCLILARSADAAAALGRLFLTGRVAKTYWAVVEGPPTHGAGCIDLPLLKVRIPGGSKVVVTPEGKPAITDWRVLAADGGLALLELRPRTGRMHQLRAHCAYSGFPILGDPIYGAVQPASIALQLLARRVEFPWSGCRTEARVSTRLDVISAEAPIPSHMSMLVEALLGHAAGKTSLYR